MNKIHIRELERSSGWYKRYTTAAFTQIQMENEKRHLVAIKI